MKQKMKRSLSLFLMVMLIVAQVTVPQLVSAEKQYIKQEIYSEDFDHVSDETLASWSGSYSLPATPGKWYFEGKKPELLEHTSAEDKCISIQPHTGGTDDYVYFALPEAIGEDGLYTITFDYYYAGSWCDWFYLGGANNVFASNSMGYTGNNWIPIEMTIDTTNKKWIIQSATSIYEVPAANTSALFNSLPISVVMFRLHNAASTGTRIKFDNFKVYKTIENPNYDIDDDNITLYDKWGTAQDDLENVDIKLGKIAVDFGDEAVDESTVTADSVKIDGGVSYETRAEDNMLNILITSQRLEYDTDYTLRLDGLKTKGGKTVTTKEVAFKTIENKPIISDGTYIEYEDFEDWTNETCVEHYNDKYITLGGFRTWTAVGIVPGKDGKKALTPMNGATQASRGLQYYFVPKLERDNFTIDYDFYTGDIENFSGMTLGVYRTKDGYGMNMIPYDGMTALGNKTWGHIAINFTANTGVWKVKITNEEKETVYENEGTWTDPSMNLLEWVFTSVDANKNLVDENVPKIGTYVVNAVYTSAPQISEKSVTIYEGETVQEKDNVSPSSNKIVIDFGQRMMPEDMNKETVYLTEHGDSTPITTTDRYANGKYELSPVDYLTAGKTYTLHIKQCRNVSKYKTKQDYDFDFTVGKGRVVTELLKLVENGAEVRTISDLSPGNAKLQVLYYNSTGEPYTLHYILAFYQENEMAFVNYDTATLSGYSDGQVAEIPIEIPEMLKGYDEVNILAWDSFSGMLPVSEAFVLQ